MKEWKVTILSIREAYRLQDKTCYVPLSHTFYWLSSIGWNSKMHLALPLLITLRIVVDVCGSCLLFETKKKCDDSVKISPCSISNIHVKPFLMLQYHYVLSYRALISFIFANNKLLSHSLFCTIRMGLLFSKINHSLNGSALWNFDWVVDVVHLREEATYCCQSYTPNH